MISISHESPVELFEMSLMYNDYQYCLVHLMEENSVYEEWFLEKFKARCPNGEIMLDNSIFELGTAFDSVKYASWVDKIKPNFYIVPDALEEAEETMSKYEAFTNDYTDLPGAKIGVVQGKTWNELKECYRYMSDKCDYIAISFDYSYYNITGNGSTKLERFAYGRQHFIDRLINEGIWNWRKPHHLLGCSVAKEFKHYKITNIRSLDTSNPVVAGLLGYRYNDDLGLDHKPSTLLADLINAKPTEDQIEDIKYNTSMFKKIIYND